MTTFIEGMEVVVHTHHAFLRVFDHKQGTVARSYMSESYGILIEVRFDHFTADFKPEELEWVDFRSELGEGAKV